MGCQYKIGEQIVSNEGNYVLGLKGDQGEIYDDVKLHLDTQCQQQPKSDPLHHLNIDPLFIKVFH